MNEEQGLKQPFSASKIEGENLIIGSEKGYYKFNLNFIEQNKQLVTKLKVNGIKINNENKSIQKIITNDKAKLNYNQNTIGLTFLTNAHPYPEKLTYEYRLNPNSEWSALSNTPAIFLPYLPPENYQIEVQVTDLSTGFKYSEVLLKLTISPPFWKAWWFSVAILCMLTFGTYMLYTHRIKRHKKIEEEKSLIKNRMEAVKMEALLAQMNPHFIFNAMNSIQLYIMDNDVDNAVLFLGEFSKLIRKNLDHCTRPYIFIYEEIEYLNSYIYVENKRFNNAVVVEFTVDTSIDTYSMEIPSMSIQPFIENVFVHAFPPNVTKPTLTIDFSLNAEQLLICTIKDNGVGFSKTAKKLHKSKGISLIKERLKLLGYDIDTTLRITSSKNAGTTVVISFKV